ncbi:hypothetical protein J8L86_07610 [Shewanella sp. MMG014]|uniref:hypothetical protein n=1 Tax=Shewanella sp. MMG014 TaxID=2822691 RepID=UPI001B3698DC|nr:hypothetical protein [Shewanella sp. MMG014]MBQ4889709.1 hypothetical protein [Shewanella sp. MMG014]
MIVKLKNVALLSLLFFFVTGCTGLTQKAAEPEIERIDKKIIESKVSERKPGYYKESNATFHPKPLMKQNLFKKQLEENVVISPIIVEDIYSALSLIPTIPVSMKYCRESEDDFSKNSEDIQYGTSENKTFEVRVSKDKIIEHNGKILDFVNQMGELFDYKVNVRGGFVEFEECTTKMFTIGGSHIQKETTFSSNSDSGSDSGMEYQITSDLEHWDSVIDTVSELINVDAVLAGNRNTGVISIEDRPSAIARVDKFLEKYNLIADKQAKFLITIVRYQQEELLELGTDIGLSYSGNGLNIDGNSNFSPSSGASLIGIGKEGGVFDGSFVNLNSLIQNDFVSIETSAEVTSMHALPVPFKVIDKINYVSNIEYERDSGNDTSTRSLTTAELEIGFNMMLVSHLDEFDNITLSISIAQSELLGFDQVDDIQLPRLTENSLFQTVKIKQGDRLLLTGFKQKRLEDNNSSTIPKTFLLGGSSDEKENRTNIAIIIDSI